MLRLLLLLVVLLCRLCRAALVCRRWYAVSSIPDLQEVDFWYVSKYDDKQQAVAAALQKLSSLLAWLQLHSHAVRSLRINIREAPLAAAGDAEKHS